mgnify:CR=1 FL=1
MYALIHNDRVIIGPKEWNKAFFEFKLKQKKIDFKFISRKPVETLPLILNDQNTRIVPATVVREPINDMIQGYRGPLWEIEQDSATATYEILTQPLESAKNNYKKLLADERYIKEIAGTTTTVQDTEVSLDTSRDGRAVYTQKYVLMEDTNTINWKFVEGWLELTKTELGDIIKAVEAYIQSTFDWEKDLSDQIDAETVVEDLVKYEEIIRPTPEELGLEPDVET